MSLLNHIKRIHFVGIGGVGMCGIAEVLHRGGFNISGSDCNSSTITDKLTSIGIHVSIGHKPIHLEGVDALVRSTAIADTNVEIIAAKKANIPIVARAEMLAELMRGKHGIAISGTHGKTTTTSILSCLLNDAKLDPSFIIGGKLNSAGTHAQLGKSDYIVVEADESDASFLFLKPIMAVITNLDEDHMTTYNNDFNRLRQAFINFLQSLPFYGTIAACIDDDNVRNLLGDVSKPITTYGFHPEADVRAVNWQQHGLISQFTVQRKNQTELTIRFNLPGQHNVQNALAAIVIASKLSVSDNVIEQSLANFQGVARRFHMLGNVMFQQGQATLIDDYGHHPREIDSTISAIRKVWPNKRLVHVFQPHRYSRTKDLFDDFSQTLAKSDSIVLLDIYSAGEPPIEGISSDSLAQSIRERSPNKDIQVLTLDALPKALSTLIHNDDILLMQGAGSISNAAQSLAKAQVKTCQ